MTLGKGLLEFFHTICDIASFIFLLIFIGALFPKLFAGGEVDARMVQTSLIILIVICAAAHITGSDVWFIRKLFW